MKLTNLTVGFIEYLGLNVAQLTEAEGYGLATTLFHAVTATMECGTPLDTVEELCYGADLYTELGCKVWRYLERANEATPNVLMGKALLDKYPDCLGDNYLHMLHLKACRYLQNLPAGTLPFINPHQLQGNINFHEMDLTGKNKLRATTTGEVSSMKLQ